MAKQIKMPRRNPLPPSAPATKSKDPLWHNPQLGDEVTVDDQLYKVTAADSYKNGNGFIRLESGSAELRLRGKLPFSSWAHWKGIAAGKKSSYRRP